MKTIFITITRGTLARNILRAGVLKNILLHGNIKVVIIVPDKTHDYFRKEFNNPKIEIECIDEKIYKSWRNIFGILFNGLVYTETEHRKIKFGGGYKKPEPLLVYWLKHTVFSVISRIKFLKYLARFAEYSLFTEKEYDYLFEKHKPDILFCSSIYSKSDVILIKAAKRFNVMSISMPKSWDTVGRLFFRAPSNKIILNNDYMKNWVIKEQLIKEKDIYVSGFPQFDIYKRKEKYLTKEEFCNTTGLDKNKPIILYASAGAWTHWDEVYVDELIDKHNILNKYNLILRPHFSNTVQGLYRRFKKYKGICVDDKNIRITSMFGDQWDPTEENMDWLAEVINVSDAVIAFASTFVLDVFVYDKPVINIYYDLSESHSISPGKPVIPMKELYNCTHYNAVLSEKSTTLAKSGDEVMEWLQKYLENPSTLKNERKNTINKLCYKIDGNSSKRISDIIINNI